MKIKSILVRRRSITLTICLSLLCLLSGTTGKAAPATPGLPDVLRFTLEDGRHRSPGLTLSFAPPGVFEYECRRIVFREERHDREITIRLLDVAPSEAYEACRMAKEPAPIQERIVLPTEPGDYRIVFINGGRRDHYTLAVTERSVDLEAEGSTTFTACDQTGRLNRVGAQWLWVEFSFLTVESHKRLATKRDEVLSALAALGAKPLTPVPGRYLLDGFVREIPGDPKTKGDVSDQHFFLWEGDWKRLRDLASRYQKYAKVAVRRPVMILWLSSRDNVVSTAGGVLNTSILDLEPRIITPPVGQ
ncbi:MAG: hypothetical protein FIA97_13525 [Methylococcaceae bacterium]|nr:hypothetical protein [Methylococcaceae bacterium]